MGYCYEINYRTGRRRLVCDTCGEANGTTRKRPCPHGYCPAPAICAACWDDPNVRAHFNQYHLDADCAGQASALATDEARREHLLATGQYIRTSAIGIGTGIVRVTFRNRDRDEQNMDMREEIYRRVPLGKPAIPADYL